MRHIRLLPLVIAVGLSLLTVKGFGLLKEAQAEVAGDSAPQIQTDGSTATSPSDDPAADDVETASAAEVDVLTSLTKRRMELDAREQDLAMRQNVITAAEQRIDQKIAGLQALQTEIQKLLGQRDVEEQKQIASLVKTYSAMKPKDAARIFDSLDDDVLLAVAQQMKSDVLAPILAGMQADHAQKLTVRLADRLKVTPPPAAPVAAPAAPAPDGTSPAAPAQTAATGTTPAPQAAASPPAGAPPAKTAATTPPPAAKTPAAAPKAGG
jgi:flagellar motility protein MotE (MotC chaperone)